MTEFSYCIGFSVIQIFECDDFRERDALRLLLDLVPVALLSFKCFLSTLNEFADLGRLLGMFGTRLEDDACNV